MKPKFVGVMSIWALILGFASSSIAWAQAQDNGEFLISNTQSTVPAQYSGSWTVQVYYATYGNINYPLTITFSEDAGWLAPSAQKDYHDQILEFARQSAQLDADANSFGTVSFVTIVPAFFSFAVNIGVQVASVAPSSSNAAIPVNTAWSPSLAGGSGGVGIFCVAGATNWGTESWTPTWPGDYTFYVATKVDPGFAGNVVDPIQGTIQINFTAYTVTVF